MRGGSCGRDDALLRSWRELSPPALFVASFALLVFVGTAGLLVLPGLYTGPRLGVIDALFTITSATGVTGLAVVDTATYWGQAWILLFLQLGGLGLISLTTLIIGALGRRLSLRTAVIAVPVLAQKHGSELVRLALAVALYTLAFELAGALSLFFQWLPRMEAGDAAWHAVFHSVSAFCDAGFSTFSTNLVGQAGEPGVVLTVSLLIVGGGFGTWAPRSSSAGRAPAGGAGRGASRPTRRRPS